MRYLSRAYTRAAFGHVATAVCGARDDRVFLTTELPELMSNTKIETINGIAHEIFKKLYESSKGALLFMPTRSPAPKPMRQPAKKTNAPLLL